LEGIDQCKRAIVVILTCDVDSLPFSYFRYINSDDVSGLTSDSVVMQLLIQHIEPLLWKYKVNLAFWGHNHAFQRQSAVYQSVPVQKARVVTHRNGLRTYWYDNPQATVHMVVGTGGAQFSFNYVAPFPAWAESVFYRHGYARAHALNATHLQWNFVDATNGTVYDHVFITQDPSAASWVINNQDVLRHDDSSGTSISISLFCVSTLAVVFFKFVAVSYYNGRVIFRDRRLGYSAVPDAALDEAL
jgi:hypothetical protein